MTLSLLIPTVNCNAIFDCPRVLLSIYPQTTRHEQSPFTSRQSGTGPAPLRRTDRAIELVGINHGHILLRIRLLVIRGTDVIWASNLELLELIFFLKEQAAQSAAQRAGIHVSDLSLNLGTILRDVFSLLAVQDGAQTRTGEPEALPIEKLDDLGHDLRLGKCQSEMLLAISAGPGDHPAPLPK
ncbi:hypothetical protein J6590_094194 [Homalodisca vitripennis]|nr:hypothetical protein J6590_010710 [Homalodisca vitripennis]KAG8334272.1 hypothetical protein J6590_094194 [Homalodisca vitripennis]